MVISKKFFKDIGGFSNEIAGEELEFWARDAYFYPVTISDKITAYYFRDTYSVVETLAKNTIKDPDYLKNILLYDISLSVRFLMNESKKDLNILI